MHQTESTRKPVKYFAARWRGPTIITRILRTKVAIGFFCHFETPLETRFSLASTVSTTIQ